MECLVAIDIIRTMIDPNLVHNCLSTKKMVEMWDRWNTMNNEECGNKMILTDWTIW